VSEQLQIVQNCRSFSDEGLMKGVVSSGGCVKTPTAQLFWHSENERFVLRVGETSS